MIDLIYNEMIKLAGKKRLLIVTLIMAAIIGMFTYAQMREAERTKERLGTNDWRATLQQQILNSQNRSGGPNASEERRKQTEIRVAQLQYYLDHNINPNEPGAPTFMRGFLENAVNLLLPLLVMVVAADLVSSEHSQGTIKLLLTRPIKRWQILLSKYLALVLAISLILLVFGLLSYLISGAVFGFQGAGAPTLIGFAVVNGALDTTSVKLMPQWQYIFMEFGLAWFVALVVGTLSFMLSVLIKSTAAGMGVMLAALISGVILSGMIASWESAKYLFMVNLQVIDYLSGGSPPVEGMTLGFSLAVLLAWGAAGLLVSFWSFLRQDVY